MRNHKHMSNQYFDIMLDRGFITSLKCTKDDNNTEFIWKDNVFGSIYIRAQTLSGDNIVICTDETEKTTVRSTISDFECKNSYEINNSHGLNISSSLKIERNKLFFDINLKNTNTEPIEVIDLAIPFPMNSKFDWGENASEKIIRHSFISGHNSYLFFTRCDGKPPYLLFIPRGKTKFEFFDRITDHSKKYSLHDSLAKHYRVFIHSKGMGRIAKSKGCNWRQENTSLVLCPSESQKYSFVMMWCDSYEDIRKKLYENHLIDIEIIPGMTIPKNLHARMCLNSTYEDIDICAEYPKQTKIIKIKHEGGKIFYDVFFERLGENKLILSYGNGKQAILEFFVTEPIETLIKKRSKFISKCQHKNKDKWYDGLISEWSNDTSTLLGPDNYDRISGWRIYAVSCDDPGLSKPAFMSTKNTIYPIQDEINALEYYIDNFVWQGLQRTDKEEFSYGIYGIPDWYINRNSDDQGIKGKLHIWRIYDYPHIILLYYNMYLIGKRFRDIKLKNSKETYLERAYRTALAMFIIPNELVDWSAYRTGLYNELIIKDIINELLETGQIEKSMRLKFHWEKKVRYFINECTDLFGSEYPFDTTGFESTHALAKYALQDIYKSSAEMEEPYFKSKAIRFMENQMACNIACRGWLEPAYYLLGSDYRGCSSTYTLSYMSQMGGWSIIDYALFFSDEPYKYLRLGYASILSSWALMNTGTPENNYGFWFKGEQNDGAACGGFEPAPYGETWLGQPYVRGTWYYSCEIDLGYCGALRAAATVLSFDDKFGLFCFGGELEREGESTLNILPKDGVRQKFYVIKDDLKMGVTLDRGNFSDSYPIVTDEDINTISLAIDTRGVRNDIKLNIFTMGAQYTVYDQNDRKLGNIKDTNQTINIDTHDNIINIKLIKER